jgi:putative membrane protein
LPAEPASWPPGADKRADGNARVAEGTGTLHSGAAAVSPTRLMGQSDAATALGPVGVLALGSVAAVFVLRRKQPQAAAA